MRFENLPRACRQATVIGLGYRNYWVRYGKEYCRTRQFLDSSKAWPLSKREEWQQIRLQRLIEEAARGSEFYADMPLAAALRSKDLSATLAAFPLLQKSFLKEQTSRVENKRLPACTSSATSGSTGQPMTIKHDANSVQRRFAFLHDHTTMLGCEPFSPSIRLSGRIVCQYDDRRPWLFNPAENQLFVSSYCLDGARAAAIADKVRASAPVIMDGYPSACLQILRILDKYEGAGSSLKAVITTAETLADDVRAEISRLGNCIVADYYAASEGVPLIQQCSAGIYHARWQSGIFEVATAAGVKLEGSGELICTSFVQDKTPLVRYATGDVVEGFQRDYACRCGLITPVVEKIVGRVEDMIRTRDGRSLGMFSYRTLKNIEGLGDSQIVQLDYDRFHVLTTRLSCENAAQKAEEIAASFSRVLGYTASVRLEVRDRLSPGPNGKVRLVMSRLGAGQLND